MRPAKGAAPPPLNANEIVSPSEDAQNRILALSPANDTQRWLKAEAVSLTDELVRLRWRVLGSNVSAVPRTFLAMVIFWLTATFASFGLYAPRNAHSDHRGLEG